MTNQTNYFKHALAPAYLHHAVRALHLVPFRYLNYKGWFRCLWYKTNGGCFSP